MENIGLQETWDKLNSTLQKQKRINDKIIKDIIKIKFSNKLKSIMKYEWIGTVILLITSVVLFKNRHEFDTLPLQITAAICLLIILILPVLSLSSIYRMKNMDMSSRSCKDNVIEYSKRQKHFLLVQKLSVALAPILMLVIIPPFMKISKDIDIFTGEANHLLWYLPLGIIAILIFAKWGYGCYVRISNDAKNIIKELNGDSDD